MESSPPSSEHRANRIIEPQRRDAWQLWRYVGYTIAILVILALLPLFGRRWGIQAFLEGHAVEWLQFVVVAMSSLVLLYGARCHRAWRGLLGTLGWLTALAAVREWDAWLDQVLPIGGWQLPALVCLIAAVVVFIRHWAVLGAQIDGFIRTASFGVWWVGVIVLLFLAQLVAHEPFLTEVLGEDYNRHVKRLVEETLELFGYTMILIGSIELFIYVRLDTPRNE